ncbi:hypothetical protein LIER_41419 [Lithospermum erythrorhizon]|uniref:Uncharacterized protein n=1 Tax=Lithospermum erythrorhizon TaxID=34254 RepID=A0AAV3RD11_LITER
MSQFHPLIHEADKKIVIIAYVEGLRMNKFKESLMRKSPSWKRSMSVLINTSGLRRGEKNREGAPSRQGEVLWTRSGRRIRDIPKQSSLGATPSPSSRMSRRRRTRRVVIATT